jgi:hypothetical protein
VHVPERAYRSFRCTNRLVLLLLGMAAHTLGSVLLRLWMKEERVTPMALATRLDVHHNTVGRWKRGEGGPTAKVMLALEKLSAGKVPMKAWGEDAG